MSFSGKRYRRVRYENVDNLVKASIAALDREDWKEKREVFAQYANEHALRMLASHAPVFSFTRIDERTMKFVLEAEDRVCSHIFTLGEEYVMERRDGNTVRMTYSLEGDNVLNHVVKQRDGKVSFFRREFSEKDTKMIITSEETNVQAVIYYEVVD